MKILDSPLSNTVYRLTTFVYFLRPSDPFRSFDPFVRVLASVYRDVECAASNDGIVKKIRQRVSRKLLLLSLK